MTSVGKTSEVWLFSKAAWNEEIRRLQIREKHGIGEIGVRVLHAHMSTVPCGSQSAWSSCHSVIVGHGEKTLGTSLLEGADR